MSEFGIPMLCGHDIVHKEDVCIVCVIANETANLLDYLRMFNTISATSKREESIIDGFLNEAREYIDLHQGPETYIIKGESAQEPRCPRNCGQGAFPDKETK